MQYINCPHFSTYNLSLDMLEETFYNILKEKVATPNKKKKNQINTAKLNTSLMFQIER